MALTNALTVLNKLKQEITCTICLDLFTEPITLTSCQHSFCSECFKELFSNKKSTKSITCPLCKKNIQRRDYYLNDHLTGVVDLVKKLENMLEEGDDSNDDIYDRINRMQRFLDDCITYREIESISLSSEESDASLLKKINNEYGFNLNSPKTPVRKTRSLNCSKVKGKYSSKKPRQTAKEKYSETLKIEEYDSPDVYEEDEENKIVKLLEDDCLRNFENEVQVIKIDDKENKVQNSNTKTTKRQSKRNTKSAESSTSKKTNTGWSRMKNMKKQIKKKEVKYKQLNVSTEINKSKSKSPQNRNDKNTSIENDAVVVLKRLSNDKSNKTKQKEKRGKSVEHKTVAQNEEDCVFSMCTQKLEEEVQIVDAHKICTPEKRKSNSFGDKNFGNDTELNMSRFIVDVQIHRSSTPRKVTEEEIIVEKVCSKQSVQENICNVEKIANLSKEQKNKKSKESSKSSDPEVINATEESPKEPVTRTRRSLRSATKRNLDENNSSLKDKSTPKKRRFVKQNSKELIDLDKNKNAASSSFEEFKKIEESITEVNKLEYVNLDENNSTLKNKSTPKKKRLSKQNSKEVIDSNKKKNEEIIDDEKLEYVKNELEFFAKQEPTVISALQNSMNAINVVLSQCSNYVHSESLFSESSTIKSKIDKPNILLSNFRSLPLESISHSTVDFNKTVIPCLKKIEDFFNKVITLSQLITDETEDIRNKFSYDKDCEKLVIALKSTNNVEIQTETLKCPKCSHLLDLKSDYKTNNVGETTVIECFKEVNDLDPITEKYDVYSIPTQDSNAFSKESSESNLIRPKKVNRQLTFSEESQRRKFKRIRSPTPDSDSESIKSKRSNISSIHRSRLLYRDDIDILFESEPSDKFNLSLGTQSTDKLRKKIIQDAENNIVDKKLASISESENKDVQFDEILRKQNEKPIDTVQIIDNLLGNISASQFENDFEDNSNNTTNILKKVDSHPGMSASMFLQTEGDDKTKSIEKQLEAVISIAQNVDDKKLDEEVENLINHDIIEDSLESEKDLFKEDDIVESTPQKNTRNSASNIDLSRPLLDIIAPPPSVTEKLDWIEIAPPPPPEFQDTEVVEQPKPANINISSLTPDIFGLHPLNKAFFGDGTILSGNTTTTKQTQQNKDITFSENVIPGTVIETQNPGNVELKMNFASTSKRNLNPIVLAQKEKFSPLQIVVSQNPTTKTINLTPKHQKSILSYMKTPQKEVEKPQQNIPVEDVPIEVCESPELKTTDKELNKLTDETASNVSLQKSKYSACIACTRLKREEITQVFSLTQKVRARYCKDFDRNVTHMIVSADDQNRIQDHTIKYVLAIAHSIWVVSFAWVRDSLLQNRLMPEEPYEVLDVSGKPGPKISRLTRLSDPLFKNFVFCCADPLSVDKNDIENAILSLGGEIKRSPCEFANEVRKHCLILAEDKETQNFDHYQVWREKYNVLIVDLEWFSRSVGQYQITSVRPYMLCLETGINDLGYPPALIAPVPETLSMSMTNTNH